MQQEGSKKDISKGKQMVFIFSTLLFLLMVLAIISEILLYFFHYDSVYQRMQNFSLNQARWWTCDSTNGPRYVQNQAGKEDSIFLKDQQWYFNRLKIVNKDGYQDKDEFVDIQPGSDSLKILFAGDSFTWGASADIDSSYVEVFEKDIKNIYPELVWNTGIPATGTNHALFTVKKYLPVQKSNYVILGFFTGNDFSDNLLPFNQLVFTDLTSCYNLFDYDRDFVPYKITKREAFKKATGSYPMDELNIFQKLLIRSRFVAFLSDMEIKVANRLSGNKKRAEALEYKMTKEYLRQLNEFTRENNAELIVLVIPSLPDIRERGAHYQLAVKILNELSVKYLETVDLYSEKNYRKSGGGHWINSGHNITGHALSKYLLDYIKLKKQMTFRKPDNSSGIAK